MSVPLANILSIDLEDWNQLIHRRLTGTTGGPSSNVDRQLDSLLSLLEEHRQKATFFTLGMLAQARPDVVRRVAAAGHEIASHGFAHRRVYQMTPEEFRADLTRSKTLLE